MQNKPFHSAFDHSGGAAGSLIDPAAGVRILVLKTLFGTAAFLVLARLIWVQTQLQDRYLQALSTTITEYEVVPARDGRILTESSDVLAVDVDQHRLQIHYRWLQDPVDDAWLNRQVRRRLSRTERRDADLVQQTVQEIRQQRLELWKSIIVATGTSPDQFRKLQLKIQERVQRISDSVNRRRQQNPTIATQATSSAEQGLLMSWATAVRNALTQAPERSNVSRIAVREEESFHDLLDDVPLAVVAMVEEQQHRFPGVRIVTDSRRTYPQPRLAPHVVGARKQAPQTDDSDTDSNLREKTTALFGVERSYDHVLKGLDGRRKITRNRRYQILKSEIIREAVAGRDVTLTIDRDLQAKAQSLLENALNGIVPKASPDRQTERSSSDEPRSIPLGGCIVVSEVQTGRLLVAASAPSFPLSLFTGATQEAWDQANQDRRHPFLFRVTQMEIPPGSAVKPLTAVAGLGSGFLNPLTPFHCQGYLDQPDQRRCLIYRLYGQSHQQIVLADAIAQSCNVYFFDVARRMGGRNLRMWFERFGLGRATGIDLPDENTGHLPAVLAAAANDQQTTMGIAIGQNRLTTTPLQINTAIAAIANGGYVVTPHLVSETGPTGPHQAFDSAPRQRLRTALPLDNRDMLQFVRDGMEATVQSVSGTAYRTGRLAEVSIAGKTGTAQTSPGKNDHAWFVGYAPAKNPRYAFTVVLEHGGSGSKTAAPIAKELLLQMHQRGLLEP